MTSVQGRGYLRQERLSVAPLFVAPLGFSPPSESELSDQLARPLGAKLSIFVVPTAATNIPKYSKNNLQQILKAVLKA